MVRSVDYVAHSYKESPDSVVSNSVVTGLERCKKYTKVSKFPYFVENFSFLHSKRSKFDHMKPNSSCLVLIFIVMLAISSCLKFVLFGDSLYSATYSDRIIVL